MHRCLELAKKGAGKVAPNPMVGAILVYNDTVIGEGWHEQYGAAHAEVNCIDNVAENQKELIKESTLYVSLEPCAHYGKTPPCADLIIENSIPTVVIGCKDSFAAVDGKGIEKLKAAGTEVITGILEKEALELNKRFFTFNRNKRPYIILKWAQTADEKIASPGDERLFISNAATNRLAHKWRSEEAAILVGTNTALKDNPSLTTRFAEGNNPVRLVIDKQLKLPATLNLFNDSAKTIIYNLWKDEKKDNVIFVKADREKSFLKQIMQHLYENKLQSVIVEGGAQLLQSFIDGGLWDEARVFINKEMKIGVGLAAPVLKNHLLAEKSNNGSDTIEYFKKGLL